jgi:hypothetical protein
MTTKKILAFMLLLIVAAPLFFSAGFIIKKQTIQARMKQRLKTALLQTVSVPANEVQWIKANKEILVNGQMFDVQTSTPSGDRIIFTGLYDEDEHKLHKSLRDFVENKKRQSAPIHQLLEKFFSTAVTVPFTATVLEINWKHIPCKFWHYPEKIPFTYRNTVYQPPRI